MRILDFDGEVPKVKPQALSQKHAQYAENVDLYGGVLRPHRRPQFQQYAVNELGQRVTDRTKAAMLARVGSHMVAFPTDVHWVNDPRDSAGKNTILFVRDGKLWRLSERMIDAGTGATPVGIDAPADAPVAAVAAGQGCKSEWDARCGKEYTRCEDEADAPEVRGYRITYVNECGEESAPSPVSNLIDVRNGDGAMVVDPNTPPKNAVKRRYYRSAVTTDGNTVWLFVDEDHIEDSVYIDSVCPNALGEVLPTEKHITPSDCLDGVALGRNMDTIVWSGNKYWVSVPRAPHAYLPETEVTLPYKIQFIADHTPLVEGDTHYDISIATTGYPYASKIRDDGQSAIRELAYWYPALSPFGWTVLNGSVYYPAEAGMVAMHDTKVELVTDALMTEREWAQFMPSTMRTTGYDQRLFMWYTKADGSRAGAILIVPMGDKRREASFSRLTLGVTSALATVDLGMIMLIGVETYRWGAGTGYLRYTWWSKIEVNSAYWFPAVFKAVSDDFPVYRRGLQHAVAKFDLWKKQNCTLPPSVFFDANPDLRRYMVQLLEDGADFQFTIYCDGEEYYSRPLRSAAPAMIKASKRGIEWSIKVSGTAVVRELHLQKSLNDLQNDGGHA